MNVPRLRFSEFSGDWNKQLLGDIFTFKNGINASKEQYGSGYKFINVLDIINNNFIYYENIIGSVNISEQEFIKNEVRYGDVLFQRSSETRDEVGQSNIYMGKQPVTFGGFVIRGRGVAEYYPQFFKYILKTDSVRDEVTQRSGGSTRYNIGQNSLNVVPISLPTIEEQTKIANFLTAVDEKIAQLTQKADLLARYKKGVMLQLFSQQLRFKDVDRQDFPDWIDLKLADISTIVGGGTPDTTVKEYWNGDIQWFTPTELKTKYVSKSLRTITESGLKNSSAKILPVGTLLFSSRATVGDISIALNECTTNQGFQSFIVNNVNCNKFVYYWILNNKHVFIEKASGSTFLEISKKEIEKLEIKTPSLPEQTKIANFLTSLDDKISYNQTQLNALKQYKQGLLQQLFV